jgi:hypothetical protein
MDQYSPPELKDGGVVWSGKEAEQHKTLCTYSSKAAHLMIPKKKLILITCFEHHFIIISEHVDGDTLATSALFT